MKGIIVIATMLVNSHRTTAQEIEIIAGLLQLRRDGHFQAIWVNGDLIRVQYDPGGPTSILGWKTAARMVATAREAAAKAAAPGPETIRKGPDRERSQRAAAAANGKAR